MFSFPTAVSFLRLYPATLLRLCLALALTAASGLGSAADLKEESVAYGADAKGFLVTPNDGRAHPGLILIHEWWGLNEQIRNQARAFAKQGYAALAVDLYGGRSATTPDEARNLAGAVRANLPQAMSNLAAATAYLQKHPGVDGTRLASVGWCFGGGWSYQMAKSNMGLRASVMYYGAFAPADDLAMMKADLLGHFAESDRSILIDDVKQFQIKLKTG